MRNLISRFCRDESGSVFVGDWAFVATILVLGAVTGMVALHQPTPDEPDDAPRAAAVHPAAAHIAPTDAR
jgi:Flp pilus assembly pilin Flp